VGLGGLLAVILGDHIGKAGACRFGCFLLWLLGTTHRRDDVAEAAFELFPQLGLGFGKCWREGFFGRLTAREESGVTIFGHWIWSGGKRWFGSRWLFCRRGLRGRLCRWTRGLLWLVGDRLLRCRFPGVFRWWCFIVFGRTPVRAGFAMIRLALVPGSVLLWLSPGLIWLSPRLIGFTRSPAGYTSGRWWRMYGGGGPRRAGVGGGRGRDEPVGSGARLGSALVVPRLDLAVPTPDWVHPCASRLQQWPVVSDVWGRLSAWGVAVVRRELAVELPATRES